MKVYCVIGTVGKGYLAYEELVKIFKNEKRADTWIALVGKYILSDAQYPENGFKYSKLRIEPKEIE